MFNADGIGYGLYPPSFHLIKPKWESLNPVEKGSLLVQSYEQILESSQGQMSPRDYLSTLKWVMKNEENQLLINEVLRQVEMVFWNLLDEEVRQEESVDLERTILSCLNDLHKDPAIKKTFFNSLKMIAKSQPTLDSLYRIWSGELSFEDLNLSENDQISLASILCIKLPEKANEIVLYQTEQIKNPDARKRFEFISPSLSADEHVRDEFFEALNNESNRQTESWVLMALSYLHHPLRVQSSVKYLKPSLDLLQEIQVTGDIFFPKRWLDQTLTNHHSEQALKIVEDFIEDHPDYNQQLRMKILQAADFGKRANAVQKAWTKK